jgi:hypothetical protein
MLYRKYLNIVKVSKVTSLLMLFRLSVYTYSKAELYRKTNLHGTHLRFVHSPGSDI